MKIEKYHAWQKALEEGQARLAKRLRDELVFENKGLCKMVLRRFRTRLQGDKEDLEQAGMIGLMSALDRYDVNKGAFSTFAVWRILHEMQKAQAKQAPVHRPKYLDTPKHRATAPAAFTFIPSDNKDTDSPFKNGLQLTSDQQEILEAERFEIWNDLSPAFDLLTTREQEVIFASVWQELTFAEIGERLNLTRERIRQVHDDAMGKMRHFLDEFQDDYHPPV